MLLRLIAALAVSTLVACTRVGSGAGTQGGGNPWTHHGVLRMADLSEPDNLNPVVGNQQIDVDLSMFWGGYLFNWSDTNTLVPELATVVPTLENGGIAKDGRTITYHLRRGVKWHDGAPFSADDVIFTWHAVMNPKNNVGNRTGYELITAIDRRDDATIVVHVKEPYAPFVASFFTMSSTPYPILPNHLLAQYPNINTVAFNNRPVGTGPFKVVEWKHGTRIKFAANQSYWRGAPKLKEIDYNIVPDQNTILTQLRTHEADFEYNASSVQYASLKDIPGTRTTLTPFTQYNELGLNLKSPLLSDRRVRQALEYAIDRQQLIDDVTHGVQIRGDSDQPNFIWAYNTNIKKYPFDPARAKKLLDEAGWLPAGDGIRSKGGRRLSLSLVGTTGSVTSASFSVIIQREWRDVGVDASVKNYVSPLMFASYGAGGILQTGKFDVAFFSWINGVDPDDSQLVLCNQWPPAGQNIYHYCNQTVDAQQRVALTVTDQKVRKTAYDKIQEAIAEDVPFIILYFTRRVDTFNTDFKNYKPAHAVSEFWNSWEWEI